MLALALAGNDGLKPNGARKAVELPPGGTGSSGGAGGANAGVTANQQRLRQKLSRRAKLVAENDGTSTDSHLEARQSPGEIS